MLHVLLLVLGGRGWFLLVSTRAGTWLDSVPGARTMADISSTNAGAQPLVPQRWEPSTGPWPYAWSALVGTAAGAEVARVVGTMVGLEEIMGVSRDGNGADSDRMESLCT